LTINTFAVAQDRPNCSIALRGIVADMRDEFHTFSGFLRGFERETVVVFSVGDEEDRSRHIARLTESGHRPPDRFFQTGAAAGYAVRADFIEHQT
jgi:hypothetical protein